MPFSSRRGTFFVRGNPSARPVKIDSYPSEGDGAVSLLFSARRKRFLAIHLLKENFSPLVLPPTAVLVF